MYSDKCNDVYEMYNYEKQKNINYENNNNIVMLDIYKLKHNIQQVNVNSEIKINLIRYEYDSSLYNIYDTILEENYILTHKYNQLLINKEIEQYSNNLIAHNSTHDEL
jgi:hypothetical protein